MAFSIARRTVFGRAQAACKLAQATIPLPTDSVAVFAPYGCVDRYRSAQRLLVAFAIGSASALLIGCAATPIELTGGISYVDSRNFVYDELLLDFVTDTDAGMEVAAKSSGDGAKEGLGMMLKAPVACMETGMYAGFCMVLAPLFPLIAASRVQDVATSEAELEAMAARIDLTEIQNRFHASLEAEAHESGLSVVQSASPGARLATLHAEFGHMLLEHDGYENGSITVTQPYRFSLSFGYGESETLVEGERSERFEVENWSQQRTEELANAFDRWIDDTSRLGIRETLVEWQPKVVLGPVAPSPAVRRNVIGIRQANWPFVESTSPRLAWQPLEAVLDSSVFADVSHVSYELEIFHPRGSRRLVTGLETPEYVVSEELSACAYYYWRPVARFRYRGVMHTTSPNKRRWSKTIYLSDDFVLKTPSADCEDPSPYDLEPPRG